MDVLRAPGRARVGYVLGVAVAAALAGCGSDSTGGKNNPGSGGSPALDGGNTGGAVTSLDSGSDVESGADAAAGPPAVELSGCGHALTAKVTIGGSQTFDLLLDTGSGTLGVAASTCTTCADAGLTPLYTPGPQAIDQQKTATAQYASVPPIGWSGKVFRDSVLVNGQAASVEVDLVAIESQTGFFEMLSCGTNSAQGILGLGQPAAVFAGTNSYVGQRAASGSPDVFALHMCPRGGHLWLGGYDPGFGTSPPQFTPMGSSTKYYTVVLTEVQVGGASLGLPPSDYGTALVDSGSTNFLLPKNAYAAVVAELAKSEAFLAIFGSPATFFSPMATCQMVSQSKAELDAALPPLTLVLGSNPSVSVQSPATESYLTLRENGGTSYWCPGLLQTPSVTMGLPPVDLGAPILNGKVTIYDREQHRIGFAQAKCD